MHDYDVHETIHIDCEIYVPQVRGSSFKLGPIWLHSEYVFYFRIFFFTQTELEDYLST